MQDLVKVYNHLINIPGAIRHSQLQCFPKDIDIYIPKAQMHEAKIYMEGKGFVCSRSTKEQIILLKYVNSDLYLFDLSSGYDYYFSLIQGCKLTDAGNKHLAENIALNKLVKKFGRADFLTTDALEKIFDFMVEKKYVDLSNNISLKSMFEFNKSYNRYVKRRLLYSNYNRLKLLFDNLNQGKSYAFIGPDGAGKGLFISKLKNSMKVKIIYHGDWFFIFQRLYTFLLKVPTPYNRFIFLFYYFENFLRRLKIFYWTFTGRTVFIDRFPGTNRPIISTGLLNKINEIQFKLMPKPTAFFALYSDPKVVFSRKQELSILEIEKVQTKQALLLKGTRHYLIDTTNLDAALNKILGIIYEN